MKTGSTPVAMGSSVPAWPTRFSWYMPRSLAHTSMEVHPAGLSMMRIPLGMGNLPIYSVKSGTTWAMASSIRRLASS